MLVAALIALAACGGPGTGQEPQGVEASASPTASATATGVTWSTSGCGSVTQGGLFTAPSAGSTCTVVATSTANPAVAGASTVTVSGGSSTGVAWDVTVSPPALTNPVTITLPGNYLSTISHSLCSGPGYVVNLDNGTDYVIRTNAVLNAPVQITGGRNVRIIGIDIDLSSPACPSSGLSGYVPGVIALRTAQVGTTYIEGAYIDVHGTSTDCIDPRNLIGSYEALSKGYSETDARGARDVVIQNSVCRGMSGDSNVHGDIAQTQGLYELYRSITLENVTTDTNCEGTVFEPRQGYYLANSIRLRRFDYRMDARYTPNPNGSSTWTGGAVMNSAKAYAYDQVYLQNNVVREYDPTETVVTIPPCNGNNGIYCNVAVPGGNRFASPGTGGASNAWTGVNYVSPFP